jgi:hypothetical protein
MNEFEALQRMMAPLSGPGTDSADLVQEFARYVASLADRLNEDEVECLVRVGQHLYQAALGEYLGEDHG